MAAPRDTDCTDPHAGRPNMTLRDLTNCAGVRRDLLPIRPCFRNHQRATARNPGECDGLAPDRRSRQVTRTAPARPVRRRARQAVHGRHAAAHDRGSESTE
eukprot:1585869-Prymnesium_polylepis.1